MSYKDGPATFYGFTLDVQADVTQAIEKLAVSFERELPQGVKLRDAGNLFNALRSAVNSLNRLNQAVNEVRGS